MTEERKEYLLNYQKEKLKRIPLDLRYEGGELTYGMLQEAAEKAGESITGYIKKAVLMRMQLDS